MTDGGSSLTAPLIGNDNQNVAVLHRKLEEIEDQHPSSAIRTTDTTSVFKTCFHGINALSGVGILSIPYALASGGWLSLIFLFLIAMAACYSGILIKRCMDVDSNITTYPDIGERAFGSKGRLLISIFMYLELYLVATGFLIMEGDNLQNLLPNTQVEVGGLVIGGRQLFVIIVALIILPTVWLDNLSLLSYISASGVLASFIILGSIAWIGAFGGVGFHQKGTLINWNGLPTAVSLYAFCYCAHPVFPTLYTSIEKKKQFSNVLLICFFICTLIYALMAILGYLMFGSDVQSQITLNLPTEHLSSRVAIYTTLVNPISKYGLMITPIVKASKTLFPSQYRKRTLSLLVGTTVVISTVIVALFVPFFGYLMSLVGAFLSMSASIIIPCLCYLKISGSYKRFGWEMLTGYSISIVGIIIAVIGTYVALVQILNSF